MKKNFGINMYKILYVPVIVLYVILRLNHVAKIEEPRLYPDSRTYLAVANNPLTFKNNFTASVPFVTPVVFKILGGDPENIAFFHTYFSIFAWTLLAVAVSKFIAGKMLKWLGFSAILLFSLCSEIVLFDWKILSESLSLSLMIIFISSWLFFIANHSHNWGYFLLTIIMGSLWMFTRDTNALLVLGLGIFMLFLAVIRKASYKEAIIGVVFLSLSIISTQLGNISGRWVPPNIKIIEQRILTNADALAFFQAQGMPVNSALMEFAGRKEGSIADWYETPELSSFLNWQKENGKQVYLKYLLSNPVDLFLSPFINAKRLVNSEPLFYYSQKGFETILPDGLNSILFFKFWSKEIIVVSLLTFLVAIGIAVYAKGRNFIVPLIMGLFLYPHALAVWTASGGDVNRHSYQFRVQFRLTLYLLIIYIVNFLIVKVVSNHFPKIERAKYIILGAGMLSAVLSVTADFMFNTGDTFSMGYAQVALLAFGILLMIVGGFLLANPEMLRIAIVGDEYKEVH